MKTFFKGEWFRTAFAGFTMGVANVIPGVSGGTMALITGVFDKIVEAVRQCTSKETWELARTFQFKKLFASLPWAFFISLGCGILLAFATVSRLVLHLLSAWPSLTFAFFFGLIVASVAPLTRHVETWRTSRWVSLAVGVAAGLAVVSLVPMETPSTWWMMMACGALVVCAMILPGISGSFLLLVFGQYNAVWGAVANVTSGKIVLADVMVIFWTGLGGVLGLAVFAHVLFWLLKRFHDVTLAGLMGLMIGSLWRLWPWQEVMRWTYKTETGKAFVELPAGQELLDTLVAEGTQLGAVVVRNVWPWQAEAAPAWYWIALAFAAGVAVLAATEFLANAGKPPPQKA